MSTSNRDVTGEQAEMLAASAIPLPLQFKYPFWAESEDSNVVITPAHGAGGQIRNFDFKLSGKGTIPFSIQQTFVNDGSCIFEVRMNPYRGNTMILKDRADVDDATILSTLKSFLLQSYLMEIRDELQESDPSDSTTQVLVRFVNNF